MNSAELLRVHPAGAKKGAPPPQGPAIDRGREDGFSIQQIPSAAKNQLFLLGGEGGGNTTLYSFSMCALNRSSRTAKWNLIILPGSRDYLACLTKRGTSHRALNTAEVNGLH